MRVRALFCGLWRVIASFMIGMPGVHRAVNCSKTLYN